MSYDALGRMVERVEPNDANSATETTTWVYDTSPNGAGVWKGKLHTVSVKPTGSATVLYAETHLYDSLGRAISASRTIDSTAYVTEASYDGYGRPLRTKYPVTGIGSGPISTRNVYNDFGYLKEIRNWVDSDSVATPRVTKAQPEGLLYWQADSYDVTGRIDGETYGNGVANDRVYSDRTGRLTRAISDVGNNPLGASDPTGYFKLKDAAKIVAVIGVGIVTAGVALYAAGFTAIANVGFLSVGSAISSVASGGFVTFGLSSSIIGGAGLGFGSGFAASLLNGASLGEAVKTGIVSGAAAAITAGLTHAIGTAASTFGFEGSGAHHALHGAVQGAVSEARGGEFRHGFYSGFASSSAATSISAWFPSDVRFQTLASAIIGGTASAVGGGKFANGAAHGAFTYLFNAAAHGAFRALYNEAVDGAILGPIVPWDEKNPHYSAPAKNSGGLTNVSPSISKDPRNLFKPATLGRMLKGIFTQPKQIAGWQDESNRVLYTRDAMKNGRTVDVFFGFMHKQAGQSDMLRPYMLYEVSGALNGLWLGHGLYREHMTSPEYNDVYNFSPHLAVDAILVEQGKR